MINQGLEIPCSNSQKEGKELFLINLSYTQFCPNFKLVVISHFFPPPNLAKFYPFLQSPPIEIHFNPLSSTVVDPHNKVLKEPKLAAIQGS